MHPTCAGAHGHCGEGGWWRGCPWLQPQRLAPSKSLWRVCSGWADGEMGPTVYPVALMGKAGPLLSTCYMHAVCDFSVHFVVKEARQRAAGLSLAPWLHTQRPRDPTCTLTALTFVPITLGALGASLFKNPFSTVWFSQGGLRGGRGGQIKGQHSPSSSPQTKPLALLSPPSQGHPQPIAPSPVIVYLVQKVIVLVGWRAPQGQPKNCRQWVLRKWGMTLGGRQRPRTDPKVNTRRGKKPCKGPGADWRVHKQGHVGSRVQVEGSW